MKKVILVMFVLLIVLLASCAQQPVPQQAPNPAPKQEQEIAPIPTQGEKPKDPIMIDIPNEIPDEIQALFDKAKTKTTSLHYKYRGPETDKMLYEYFIKGDLMRIVLGDDFKDVHLDKDAFNAVYMDTAAKTADGYCDHQTCIVKGKKRSASYNDYNMKTPLEWAQEITSAEKVSEEQIDNRKAWKLKTNIGDVYVDSFSGIIQRIKTSDAEYDFIRIETNGVKDEEVRPMQ